MMSFCKIILSGFKVVAVVLCAALRSVGVFDGFKNAVLLLAFSLVLFNDAGVLTDVKRLNQDDSLPVQVVSRTTPSPGSDTNFMQMLLGNVGRYNPLAGRSGGGGGAPTGGGTSGANGPAGPGSGI